LDVKPYELLEAAERWISGAQPQARDQIDAQEITSEIIRGLTGLDFADLVAIREVVNRFAIR
ncbi:MAG: hypothetical protein ABI783_10620, partial [Actinomycetota bacterium]